jgi:peptide/nickel transport system ATP-binding protein
MDRARSERLMPIKGSPPSLINVPQGCAFNPRCGYADRTNGLSQTERPDLVDTGKAHFVACHMATAERQKIWRDEIKPKL